MQLEVVVLGGDLVGVDELGVYLEVQVQQLVLLFGEVGLSQEMATSLLLGLLPGWKDSPAGPGCLELTLRFVDT